MSFCFQEEKKSALVLVLIGIDCTCMYTNTYTQNMTSISTQRRKLETCAIHPPKNLHSWQQHSLKIHYKFQSGKRLNFFAKSGTGGLHSILTQASNQTDTLLHDLFRGKSQALTNRCFIHSVHRQYTWKYSLHVYICMNMYIPAYTAIFLYSTAQQNCGNLREH